MSTARPHDLTSVCSCPLFESISIYIDSNLSRLFLPYGIYNLSWCDLHFSFMHALFQKSACIGTKYMEFVPVLILKLSHYVCASYAYISQRIFFLEKFINVFSTVSQSLGLNWSGKKKGCVTYITALVRASYKEVSITPRLKSASSLSGQNN